MDFAVYPGDRVQAQAAIDNTRAQDMAYLMPPTVDQRGVGPSVFECLYRIWPAELEGIQLADR